MERSCSCPRRPAEGRPSSKRLVAGSTPAEGSRCIVSHCHVPIFARWPRQPDSHSGNAGSNPAGDTGLIRRPVCFFGGPRLGGRACQRSVTLLAPNSRAARFAGPLGRRRSCAQTFAWFLRCPADGTMTLASCGELRISVLSVPAAGHRATNSIGEVRLLAERPNQERVPGGRGGRPG